MPDDSPNSQTDVEPQTDVELTEQSEENSEKDSSANDSPDLIDSDSDDAVSDTDLKDAKAAWENAESEDDSPVLSDEELTRLTLMAEPYVGKWNQLISTTNWEKGQIISEWRAELIESEVPATEYSDEAWARRVGGVTAPHVGRLRRVYDRFADEHSSYDDLYWSHFLAALDWEDAPMWLQGASEEGWSVSQMRQKKWESEGAVESNRPTESQIVDVDLDEDVVLPAQGGGREKNYDDGPDGVAAGPTFEGPDFGDEEELSALSGQKESGGPSPIADGSEFENPVQPFVGLPELPDDLSDAIESLKLALLRHKSDGWRDVEMETVQKYLEAIGVMIKI